MNSFSCDAMILVEMGNVCLKKVPAAYEARSVADLAYKVVEKLKDDNKVGDLEKVIEESCACKFECHQKYCN